MTRKGSKRLTVVHRHCAGIDIGSRRHFVAVDPQCTQESVRSFGSFTVELTQMGRWLRECGVEVVAMESTGVYWIAVYEVLERMGFEVHLVNPRATKQVSGRKSDVLDCQWLWQLMSYGLLKGAFRPADRVCQLRSYVRQRAQMVRDQSRCVLHMQKALTQMNIQLANVLSDITGKTGMQILRAIVAGERDAMVLASCRDHRVKADEATVAASLQGNWREEHLFMLAQALARYDFYAKQLAECEKRIVASSIACTLDADLRLEQRNFDKHMPRLLHAQLAVDLTAIPTIGVETALTVAAEVGADLSRFPSSAHFCSWLNLAPGTRISGGRALPGRAPKVVNRLGQALRVAAATARSSRSFIGAAHRARLSRMDKPRAIKATAHQLARLIYAMLTRGQGYVEKGIEHFESTRRDKQLHALRRRAKALGCSLVEQPV